MTSYCLGERWSGAIRSRRMPLLALPFLSCGLGQPPSVSHSHSGLADWQLFFLNSLTSPLVRVRCIYFRVLQGPFGWAGGAVLVEGSQLPQRRGPCEGRPARPAAGWRLARRPRSSLDGLGLKQKACCCVESKPWRGRPLYTTYEYVQWRNLAL